MSTTQHPAGRSHARRSRTLLLLALGALGYACGTNDSSSASPATGSSGSQAGGMGGRSGSGGKAGAAPAAGAAGATGAAGSSSPTIICGGQPCAAPPAGLAALAGSLPIQGIPIPIACCIGSETASVCGTAPSATGTCEPRAADDPRCPSIDPGSLIMFSGGAINGCCTADNACGVDGALFGRGCIENAEAAVELGMIPFLGSSIKVPAPSACAPVTGEDAGI